MRLTWGLWAQHLGRMFKKHWSFQRKVKLRENRLESYLAELGIAVNDPEDVVSEKRELQKFEVIGSYPRPVPKDESHPDWKERPCYVYDSTTNLPEGLNQAKNLCKSVQVQQGLPPQLLALVGREEIERQDELMQRYILQSRVFDATQEKLPFIIDKDDYHQKGYPRKWGIPRRQRNYQLLNNTLRLCATLNAKYPAAARRMLYQEDDVTAVMEKDGDLYMFTFPVHLSLMADKPLAPFADDAEVQRTIDLPLPHIYPISYSLNTSPENFYDIKNVLPSTTDRAHPYVHTMVFALNEEWKTDIIQTEIDGKTLVNTFAVAIAQAYQLYGADTKILPDPVTLNCIHTDGRKYYFGVFQLNTLDLDGIDGVKNILWLEDCMDMYSVCNNFEGRPILEGYNPSVFRIILAMYMIGVM